jgi:carbamoylphosphate synthase large subunit
MPRRDDLSTILLIGSGPIVIGQGCEFDYSGAQACKALRDEGYRVVLVNSNPATIMTDPSFADRTYIEPITPETVEKIILKEIELGNPIDAVLPTLGGQTALNCACELWDNGVFQKYNIEMIGASREVIHKAEDRKTFADICEELDLATPESQTVETYDQATEFLKQIGLPAIIRPAFTLGGWGGGIAYNHSEFEELVNRGLRASMIGQVQVDKSLIGWKEYELEVVRDKNDNCIIVCGIENIDAMGVHTGDSITVAPILTLTDKEYQVLRDASLAIMRGVGVETGGSNVQFAINPNPEPDADGNKPFEMVVIEMNPRVSRSSALASKATGFPIAKIAAKLAIGYTLDELRNDITGTTSACFEPSIDYIVTKMPRWTFEKFPEADETLTTQMKSVGEAMAIGRTFKESFQKVIRSMDVKRFGLGLDKNDKWLQAKQSKDGRTADGQAIEWPIADDTLTRKLSVPSQGRMHFIRYALKMGWGVERVCELTKIDPFWIHQFDELVRFEDELAAVDSLDAISKNLMQRAKQLGYSDAQLANLYLGEINDQAILQVRARRKELGVEAVFKCVDTCAAEFEAITPYYYSTYQPGSKQVADDGSVIDVAPECELRERLLADEHPKQKVIILGGGPNRIGQGIEFDYCCVHAAYAAQELGHDAVMINSNPETVSTDYDTSDLLFFEPLTLEDVLNVTERISCSSESMVKTQLPCSLATTERLKAIQTDLLAEDVKKCRVFGWFESGYSDGPDGFKVEVVTDDGRIFGLAYRESHEISLVDKWEIPTPYMNDSTLLSVLSDAQLDLKNDYSGDSQLLDLSHATKSLSKEQSAPASARAAILKDLSLAGHRVGAIVLSTKTRDRSGLTVMLVNGRCIEYWFDHEFVNLLGVDRSDHRAHVKAELEGHEISQVESLLREAVADSPILGTIVQFGGQTPLNLAHGLDLAGVPIIGTELDAIDRAEDRDRFDQLLTKLDLKRPVSGIARSIDEAVEIAERISYPVLVRPSYVLGGRGMEICPDEKALRHYMATAVDASGLDDAPILIDQFLDGAIELDVDVVADFAQTRSTGVPPVSSSGLSIQEKQDTGGTPVLRQQGQALVAAVMEHIEHAGVHSGDSTCMTPTCNLRPAILEEVKDTARKLATELGVCGLMNVQMALKDDKVYIIEVNPRASRTVPYVGKAKSTQWAAMAAKAMMGVSLKDQDAKEIPDTGYYAVKAPVFPFQKFPGVDFVLGPEMRSTGEVMGVDASLPNAYLKAMLGAGTSFPTEGGVFLSVREHDRNEMIPIVRSLMAMGFKVFTTKGTGELLAKHGLRPKILQKIQEGARPNVIDLMQNNEIQLVINTPTRTGWQTDEGNIRATAVRLGIPMITTATAAAQAIHAIEALKAGFWDVTALQDLASIEDSSGVENSPKANPAQSVGQ